MFFDALHSTVFVFILSVFCPSVSSRTSWFAKMVRIECVTKIDGLHGSDCYIKHTLR